MFLNQLRTYASFVRVSHSVFALPFALAGALLAIREKGSSPFSPALFWIVVAMVAARSAAMGFNRLADARIDALNPRTAARELPRGALTMREAALFVMVASVVFVYAAWSLNTICFALSPFSSSRRRVTGRGGTVGSPATIPRNRMGHRLFGCGDGAGARGDARRPRDRPPRSKERPPRR